ncbi:MAG: hypothetical protein AB2L14_27925 [Candidatus Xenobiia bacterium LiM19]
MRSPFIIFLAALIFCSIFYMALQYGVGETILFPCYGAPGAAIDQEQNPIPSASPSESPSPVVKERSGDVKSLIADVESATSNVKDYSLIGYIRLDKDIMVVDYRSVRPDKVRAEVLEGKLRGKAALYDPQNRKDSIKVKAGALRIWQNVKKLKIENTPLVESLLDTVIRTMNTAPEISLQGKVKCTARLGNTVDVSFAVPESPAPMPSLAPSAGETPVPSPTPEASTASPSDGDTPAPTSSPATLTLSPTASISPSPSPENQSQSKWFQPRTIEKECYLVVMKNDEGFVDTVAIDANDFWVFYIKRMKQESMVFEAVFTDLKVNTSPKLGL